MELTGFVSQSKARARIIDGWWNLPIWDLWLPDDALLLLQDVPYRSSLIRCLSIGTQPNISSVILSLFEYARKKEHGVPNTWSSSEERCVGLRVLVVIYFLALPSKIEMRFGTDRRENKIFKWAICQAISYNKMRREIESAKGILEEWIVIIQSEVGSDWVHNKMNDDSPSRNWNLCMMTLLYVCIRRAK